MVLKNYQSCNAKLFFLKLTNHKTMYFNTQRRIIPDIILMSILKLEYVDDTG
jgi:hypothetical protein